MNCEQTRERLESFVVGEAEDEAQAIADHLSTCAVCATQEASLRRLVGELRQVGDAFRPRLLPAELTLVRAAAQARRRRRALLAAACVVGLFAALVVALSVPASARRLPLPVGRELQRLGVRTGRLNADLGATKTALARARAELAVRRQAQWFAATPEPRTNSGREARILASVAAFFGARAAAAMPAPIGTEAQTRLAQATVPGSQAAKASASLAPSMRSAFSPASRLSGAQTVVVVMGVRMLSTRRAIVFVGTFDYPLWSDSSTASVASLLARQEYWRESVHRVVLLRNARGRWLVAEDLSVGPPAATVSLPPAGVSAYGSTVPAAPSDHMAITRPTSSPLQSPSASGTATATPSATPSATPTVTPSPSSP